MTKAPEASVQPNHKRRSLTEDYLLQCAWEAARTKQSYLQAQYLRLRSRRGAKKAICAVAASIHRRLPYAHKRNNYQDLGANHFDNRAKGKQVLRLVASTPEPGFAVQITLTAP